MRARTIEAIVSLALAVWFTGPAAHAQNGVIPRPGITPVRPVSLPTAATPQRILVCREPLFLRWAGFDSATVVPSRGRDASLKLELPDRLLGQTQTGHSPFRLLSEEVLPQGVGIGTGNEVKRSYVTYTLSRF